ncbi:dienelactone hydrolase family-domain-containing protein [Schizothecium vesticola]|uniref:Dienelactone hydrolase family-domain-containing protein n=1 Tax=Schizothecium vesticola TaxID=314040 RepID=A0AA40BQW2_9PEZI|nr:dienelactone hydrolase family-domain-containing protein [Schizothecium vesticola]
MRFSLVSLTSGLLLSGAAATFQKQCTDADIVEHTGNPAGTIQVIQNVTTYISAPNPLSLRALARRNTAVIYLTDVFGIELLQNKRLADSFAKAGYLTIAPDMLEGEALPTDLNVPGLNLTEYTLRHGPANVDPIVAKAVAYARSRPGITKVAITGYCFGGKYAFRFLSAGRNVDAGFTAHPSLLVDAEITAITKPIGLALAETDTMLTPARRAEMEVLLQATNKPYQVSLYSGTAHGFGVRADITDPEQKFAKEEAFLQAVRWFDNYA